MYKIIKSVGTTLGLPTRWLLPHNSKTILPLLSELNQPIDKRRDNNAKALEFAHRETKYANRVFKRHHHETNVFAEAVNLLSWNVTTPNVDASTASNGSLKYAYGQKPSQSDDGQDSIIISRAPLNDLSK
jgi:hypothetical protein